MIQRCCGRRRRRHRASKASSTSPTTEAKECDKCEAQDSHDHADNDEYSFKPMTDDSFPCSFLVFPFRVMYDGSGEGSVRHKLSEGFHALRLQSTSDVKQGNHDEGCGKAEPAEDVHASGEQRFVNPNV